MDEPSTGDLTALLIDWSRGDRAALDRLMPLVYQELHQIAARCLRRERHEHTLQPTALVHEAFVRLIDQRRATWQNRAQFFAVAARMMRRILVDHARAHAAAKRGGGAQVVPLDDAAGLSAGSDLDLLALDRALDRLESLDPRQARLVELRFFAGLEVREAAAALEISPATAKRDWALARAWLHRELTGSEGTA